MDGFQLWLLSFGFENEYKDDDLIDYFPLSNPLSSRPLRSFS